MVLPELALLGGRHGGERGGHGLLVEAERVVLEDDANVVRVLLRDLLESRTDSLAVGSLKI